MCMFFYHYVTVDGSDVVVERSRKVTPQLLYHVYPFSVVQLSCSYLVLDTV